LSGPAEVGEVHREVAQVVLGVADRYGFVLGGGVAWVLHGLVARRTEDLDFFTDRSGAIPEALKAVNEALREAGFEVQTADPTDPYVGESASSPSDLADLFDGFVWEFAEVYAGRDGRWLKISLSVQARANSPVVMDVGPVMGIDDLIGSKVAALVGRREVRDYIDVAAALESRTVDELLALGRRVDPGMEDEDIQAVPVDLAGFDDEMFGRYGVDAEAAAVIRQRMAAWPV
jgi:Nucleotidyl transferase AbiEii toxin, Type IV TA system